MQFQNRRVEFPLDQANRMRSRQPFVKRSKRCSTETAEIEHRRASLKALSMKGTTGTQASFLELFDGFELPDEELQANSKANSPRYLHLAWAGDAETGSRVMKISTENQGEYIVDARARMPEPVEVSTQSPSNWQMVTAGASLLTGNPGPAAQVAAQAADHERQEAARVRVDDDPRRTHRP